jgi:histidyl-tRNA synthetase
MKKIQAIRGMNDVLPEAISSWHFLEHTLRQLANCYAYQEVRLPIVEQYPLFKRTIGEVTDIVEKEMYVFTDRNGDQLALRPEGTAGCVRAAIEHGLLYNQVQKLWYMGPMFRHERPQKGRYRQFFQFGMEAFGFSGPDIDAEMIFLTARLWQSMGISSQVTLQLNSLGTPACRVRYRDALVDYFSRYPSDLDTDSQQRLLTNPLRILDSKNPAMQTLIAGAPTMLEFMDDESKQHFDGLCCYLKSANITFTINPRLVRGLDYYTKTVFEWVTDRLGSQGTVCAGGRYDGLVEQLGGQATPAFGFSLGMERLIGILEEMSLTNADPGPHAYFILVGSAAERAGFILAEQLRTEVPALCLSTHCGGGSIKTQFKRADKSGALFALILGEDELATNTVTVKYLRENLPQQQINRNNLAEFIKSCIMAQQCS